MALEPQRENALGVWARADAMQETLAPPKGRLREERGLAWTPGTSRGVPGKSSEPGRLHPCCWWGGRTGLPADGLEGTRAKVGAHGGAERGRAGAAGTGLYRVAAVGREGDAGELSMSRNGGPVLCGREVDRGLSSHEGGVWQRWTCRAGRSVPGSRGGNREVRRWRNRGEMRVVLMNGQCSPVCGIQEKGISCGSTYG